MERQQRALAIHDISCVGRCSLTVALPIVSAAGIDTSVLPTAVLSTHTGGFTGFTFRDLTADIAPITAHWESLGLHFDSIYTGYLGSLEQIQLVLDIFERFGQAPTLKMVDPVMADNGELYAIFPQTFPLEMKRLCAKADLILPNITEACLMLEQDYNPGPYTKNYIEGLLQELAALGPRQVVLTGVYFGADDLGAASYDAATGQICYATNARIEGYFHGTGDVFGSALLGGLMNGFTLADAVQLAVDYTQRSIDLTAQLGQEPRYGVCFERALPFYLARLAR